MSVSTSTISNRSKIKVVFLGDQNTGKTSIIERYMNNTFYDNPDPTVGVDFIGKNITHNGQHYRLQLWDTAGQQRFRSLVPNYLKDATCAVFVVDLSNSETIENIHKWITLFEDHKSAKAVSILCGNKKDIAPGFDRANINEILKKYPMPFIEVSARTGQNVTNLFPAAIQQMIKSASILQSSTVISEVTERDHYKKQQPINTAVNNIKLPQPIPTATFDSNRVVLGNPQNPDKKRKGCC